MPIRKGGNKDIYIYIHNAKRIITLSSTRTLTGCDLATPYGENKYGSTSAQVTAWCQGAMII